MCGRQSHGSEAEPAYRYREKRSTCLERVRKTGGGAGQAAFPTSNPPIGCHCVRCYLVACAGICLPLSPLILSETRFFLRRPHCANALARHPCRVRLPCPPPAPPPPTLHLCLRLRHRRPWTRRRVVSCPCNTILSHQSPRLTLTISPTHPLTRLGLVSTPSVPRLTSVHPVYSRHNTRPLHVVHCSFMPPRANLTAIFPLADAANEVVCPLKNNDSSNCRKRCFGVRTPATCPRSQHSHADSSLALVGEALPLHAGAHPPRSSHLLHPKASRHRGELLPHGQHPVGRPSAASAAQPHRRAAWSVDKHSPVCSGHWLFNAGQRSRPRHRSEYSLQSQPLPLSSRSASIGPAEETVLHPRRQRRRRLGPAA